MLQRSDQLSLKVNGIIIDNVNGQKVLGVIVDNTLACTYRLCTIYLMKWKFYSIIIMSFQYLSIAVQSGEKQQ